MSDFRTPATREELGLDWFDKQKEAEELAKQPPKAEEPKEDEDKPDDVADADEGVESDDSDEDQAEDDKPKRKDTRVPLSRFQKKVDEARDAKEQAAKERDFYQKEMARMQAELEAKATTTQKAVEEQKQPVFDIDAKEDEYNDLVKEMDFEKAGKLRKEINAEIRKEARREAEALADEKINKSFKQREQETAELSDKAFRQECVKESVKVIEKYEFLDSDSDLSNGMAIQLFKIQVQDFLVKGHSVADSYRLATESVVPLFQKTDKAEKGVNAKKRAEDTERFADDAARRIPPNLSKTGLGSNEEDSTLFKSKEFTQKDWNNASEADRRKLLYGNSK